MEPLVDDLREQVAKGQVVAIIGAGVSKGATGASTASWMGLLENGIGRCETVAALPAKWGNRQRASLADGDLQELIGVATEVETRLGAPDGGEYNSWLRETVGALRATDTGVLDVLRDLGVLLATTNYDDLLEKATGYPPVTWRDGPDVQRLLRGADKGILHLHGHWRDPDSVVLGRASYDRVIGDEHAQTVQSALSLMKTFLFVGFGLGLQDPNFDALLKWMRQVLARSGYRHFRLCLANERSEIQKQHPPEERIFAVPYGSGHADLAPFLRTLVAGKSPVVALREASPARIDASTDSYRPDVGTVPELPAEELRERFIGRRRLLADVGDALLGLEDRLQKKQTEGAAKVQAIWYHGFGGMGKSWFLRRAILEAQSKFPSAKIAFVDWDQPTWRLPLLQPPETPKELLQPVAWRLRTVVRRRITGFLLAGGKPNERRRGRGTFYPRAISGEFAEVSGRQRN